MQARILSAIICFHASTIHACENASEHIDKMLADPYKLAAMSVLGNDCGTLSNDEMQRLREQSDILAKAGADAIPALIFLVQDSCSSPYVVGNIANYAVQLPFSRPMLRALRARRQDARFHQNLGWYSGVFAYFARFGDDTDLAWMESVVANAPRPDAGWLKKPLAQARQRLPK
jgi:hypothetical protein